MDIGNTQLLKLHDSLREAVDGIEEVLQRLQALQEERALRLIYRPARCFELLERAADALDGAGELSILPLAQDGAHRCVKIRLGNVVVLSVSEPGRAMYKPHACQRAHIGADRAFGESGAFYE